MELLQKAREQFQEDYYATETTGIEIDAVAENYAKCSLTYEKKHLNAAGSVMGGAIFTLADFTFAVAANITGRLTVSLSSQINYVAPPKGGKITAEAKCVKSGGHTCFFSIVITDAEERTVATVSTTGYIK